MVMTQMTHHYRRVASAKPRVDTNLTRHHSPRPLSAEASRTVNRHYRGNGSPPKHRACLKYCQENNGPLFKPTIYSTGAESKLKEQCEIYHPPVKQPARSRKSKVFPEELSENGIQTERTAAPSEERVSRAEKSVQTLRLFNFRPLNKKSVRFLKDITDEALARGAQTNIALERIFRNHQERNIYRLPTELMERELDMLRRELKMPLASRRSSDSYVSDEDALRALDRLALKPETKREVIATLRLVEKEKTMATGEGKPKQPKQSEEVNGEFSDRRENPPPHLVRNIEPIKEESRPQDVVGSELESSEKEEERGELSKSEEEEENVSEASSTSDKMSNQDRTDEHETTKHGDFTSSSSQHLSVRNMSQLEPLDEANEVDQVETETDGKDGGGDGDSKRSVLSTFEEDNVEDEEEDEEGDEVQTDEDQHTDSEVESMSNNSGVSASSVHTE